MHETEADLVGLKLMARACYRPEAAARFWKNMQEASARSGKSTPGWLSTHPTHDKRFKAIDQKLPEANQIRVESGCDQVQGFWSAFG